MAILLVLGSMSLFLGILFLIDKGILKKIQDMLNKPVFKSNEQFAYKYRVIMGVILIILAAILFLQRIQ